MSNCRKSEKQTNISWDVLTSFIMSKGYIGKSEILGIPKEFSDYNDGGQITLYKPFNEKEKITIPYIKYFSMEQIEILLSKIDLSYSDFEEYLKSDL